MSEAVKEYVDKEEKEAISELVKYQLQKTQVHLFNKVLEYTIGVCVVKYQRTQNGLSAWCYVAKCHLDL